MDVTFLEDVAIEQKRLFDNGAIGLKRQINFSRYIKNDQVIVISGVRRSGKSTLLRQFATKLGNYQYINFDDERLSKFRLTDFNNLLMIWGKNKQPKNILMDEIQNIPEWERFVRRIHDEGYKVFITGSNSKLLASELATHLTGRYFKIELYPFSFSEYLQFHKIPYTGILITEEISKVLKSFDNYLRDGGMPEFLKYHNVEFLKRTYEDILYRDIVNRFNIREIKSFKTLSYYLLSNFTKETSYNSLSAILDIKSVNTVRQYVSFLEESYLFFELFKYDYSLKKQYVSNKKIYTVDNGIRNHVAFYFSDDKGRLLENLVFLDLKRRDLEIYFHKDKKECDFLVLDRGKVVEAIQVTMTLTPENEERETAGLVEALERYKLKKGIIITQDQERKIKFENHIIDVVPAWKWLLGKVK